MTPSVHPLSFGRYARAASFTVCLIAFSTLSACMAPERSPAKSAPAAADAPYESMSASLTMGKPEDALHSYEESLAARPQSAVTRVLHARLLMIAGKLAEAREEFNLVIADNPRNTDALYNLSLVDGLDGRSDDQESLLRQVVQIDDGHTDALAALGDLALGRGERAAAGAFFTRALSRDPANIQALLGEGAVLEQNSDWEAARELYTRAITAQPDYSFAYIDRARSRQALNDMEGAQADLEQAIALDPQYPWSYIDRGKLYARQSRREEAIADYSMAIRLDPSQFEAYALRADAYAARGDVQDALSDWERVVGLEPEYGYAYAPIASLSWTAGDWQKAHDAFLQAGRYDDDPSLALCAALCSVRLKNSGDIDGILASVVERTPADSWYRGVARFLSDPGSEPALLSRIDRERDQQTKARMLFYVAVYSLANDMQRVGAVYLSQAAGKASPRTIEAQLVRVEMARLTAAAGD
jgi:tetratricopeptide (TPR) repeat protein